MIVTLSSILPFSAKLYMPPDKSISHRALMLSGLACGTSRIARLSTSLDVLSTKHCLEQLGVRFRHDSDILVVQGVGEAGFSQPAIPLDCGNSGTTMRILAGMLAGSKVEATLVGDSSLMQRPMQRVVKPLTAMGGDLTTSQGRAPLIIKGRELQGVGWRSEVNSAQVKSAILLAGLSAKGLTRVEEPYPTRDHTERMLAAFGGQVAYGAGFAEVKAGSLLPFHMQVPGDVSAAAFFVVLTACLPGAELQIDGVGLNPGRIGLLEVLADMGAQVKWQVSATNPEPIGSIYVKGEKLRPFSIAGALVPRLIDELPILAVAATCANGRSEVRDAAELRVKESDRIAALLGELTKLGVVAEEFADGFAIAGGPMQGATVDSHGDHRLAMSLAVAGSLGSGTTTISRAGCVAVSYPHFWEDLSTLQGVPR